MRFPTFPTVTLSSSAIDCVRNLSRCFVKRSAPAEQCTDVCTKITPVLLLSSVPASIGSSYAGLCNGQHCVHICLFPTFSILSPLSASLAFATNVSDFGFLVIGFSMNFEISYQLYHCALAFFACSWLCSFACNWHCPFACNWHCPFACNWHCSFACCLALLFLPAVWHCSFRIRHFIDVLGC